LRNLDPNFVKDRTSSTYRESELTFLCLSSRCSALSQLRKSTLQKLKPIKDKTTMKRIHVYQDKEVEGYLIIVQ
jgi:hypothetical protein